jgi:mRNA-degrading endonuclease RelE of RelBE toxin-antitoxin system
VTYKIVIERKAEKEAEKISVKYRVAIDRAILSLSEVHSNRN